MRRSLLGTLLAVLLVLAACGGDSDGEGAAAVDPAAGASGVRVVAVEEAAEIHAADAADLVVLDVRTPAEFAEAHLDGAVLIDIYEPDFADRIAGLDRDVPYLLYCRSGNRSSEARELMAELGFTDVADIDGGIVSWVEAGQPVVTG